MPNEREITVKDKRFISRLHKYVTGEISKLEISLEDVAAYMCISRGLLSVNTEFLPLNTELNTTFYNPLKRINI